MAFTQRTFASVGANSAPSPAIFSYETADSDAQIVTSGYFTDKQGQLNESDIILGTTSTGFAIYQVQADTGSILNVISSAAPDIPGVTRIASEQDWIDNTTDVGGDTRQMILNFTYFIVGNPEHGFTLRCNGVNRIASDSVISSSNDYTGPNTFAYECSNAAHGISFDNMTINCPGKTWMNSTAALFVATDRCSIMALGMGLCNALITFFAFTRFGDVAVPFTTGMTFTTTGNISMDIVNCAYVPDNTAGALECVGLGSSTWDDVRVESTKFNLGGANIAIGGLASGGNLINAGFVNHCDLTGTTSPLSGVSTTEDSWVFTGNLGVPDSGASLGGFVESNATPTVISTINTPVLVNVGVLAQSYESERMTISTAGVVTNDGINPVRATVVFAGIADTASGTNVDFTFYVAENGAVIPGSRSPVSLDAADPGRFAAQALVSLNSTENTSLFVECNDGTTNITIFDFSVTVK